jgi:hypothetical protein
MKLTCHLHEALRFRMRGALIYSPYTPSWLGHGQLCLLLFLPPPTRGENIYVPSDSILLWSQMTETQRKDTSIENSCFNLVKWYRSYSFLNDICERQVKIKTKE